MNLSFIKLDINIMNDTKIKIIRKMPDGDSIIVLWIGLLCLGMKSGRAGVIEIGDGIPFTAETLSTELDIKLNTVKLGLKIFQEYKMIEIWDTGEQYIVNFEKHQELTKILKAKEVSRVSSQKYRENQKAISDGHVTGRDETEEEEEKNRLELEKIRLETEFEKFWNMYDKKSDRKKCLPKWKKLKDVDKEKIFQTLPTYIKSTPDKQYRKNPSTYLNNESWNDEVTINDNQQQKGMKTHGFNDDYYKDDVKNSSTGDFESLLETRKI